MSNMGAVAADDRAEMTPEGFRAWLGDDFGLHVAVKREHGDWFALIAEFDITGMGDTQADAVQQALDLLSAYLTAYWREGRSLDDARRPIARAHWLRIEGESVVGSIARRIARRLPIASESTYAVPPGVVERFALAR